MVQAQDITLQSYSSEQGGEHPVLWGSEHVQEELGLMRDDMLELADGANLIVVDRQDIVEFNEDNTLNDPTLLDQYITIPESLKAVDFDASVDNLRAIFNRVAPEIEIAHSDLENMAHDILQDRAFAVTEENLGVNNNSYGLISTPDMTVGKQEMAGSLSSLTDVTFHNIPGEAQDYLAHVMFHEAAHIGQGSFDNLSYEDSPLPYEIDADQKAFQAVRENPHFNADVIETVYETRAAGAFLQGDWYQVMNTDESVLGAVTPLDFTTRPISHMTHIGFHPEDNETAQNHKKDMQDTGNLGLPKPPDEALENMEAALTINTSVNMLGGTMLPAIMDEFKQNPDIDSDQYFLPDMNISPNDLLSDNGIDEAFAEHGRDLVQMHPEAGLAMLETLVERGMIEEGSAEMKYAQDVIGFYRDHVEGITESPVYEATQKVANAFVQDIPAEQPKIGTNAFDKNLSQDITGRQPSETLDF